MYTVGELIFKLHLNRPPLSYERTEGEEGPYHYRNSELAKCASQEDKYNAYYESSDVERYESEEYRARVDG